MELTKQQAQESLESIEITTRQLRQSIGSGPASVLLILWGAIWVVGYSASQFFPNQAGIVWLPLSIGGGLTSWIVGAKCGPVRRPGSARIGIFWLALFAYASLWAVLLQPHSYQRLGAYLGTVPMFAYVVGGLWFGRFFVWLGLGVTALIVLGVYQWPEWSELWSGLAGGLSLVAAGLYIRKFWRGE